MYVVYELFYVLGGRLKRRANPLQLQQQVLLPQP